VLVHAFPSALCGNITYIINLQGDIEEGEDSGQGRQESADEETVEEDVGRGQHESADVEIGKDVGRGQQERADVEIAEKDIGRGQQGSADVRIVEASTTKPRQMQTGEVPFGMLNWLLAMQVCQLSPAFLVGG